MKSPRRRFSICVPAYNRSRYLVPLLESVISQDYTDFNVVICEDKSPQQLQIRAIAEAYVRRYPQTIFYHENNCNLGYDANIRNLVERATGEYCFFMGNDDLMCPGALSSVANLLDRYPDVGVVLKSYAWFDRTPDCINQEVRYFNDERFLAAGYDAVATCFRRSGVISGYIVHRDSASSVATDKFDGSLYYQMHLTAGVLAGKNAVFTPRVLVLCRNSEPPDFGNSETEKGKYIPGCYTPDARVNMIRGALSIVEDLRARLGLDVIEAVRSDYANYFYPYIKDQLDLPLSDFFRLHREFCKLGFSKYPMFHLYFLVGYLLGERKIDVATKLVRRVLGRSPHFGIFAKATVGSGAQKGYRIG